jgi:hypothetical protein
LGLRTAIAKALGARIMTPSITAWTADGDLRHDPYFFSPYFFWNLSTRPAESTSFCLPVKKGVAVRADFHGNLFLDGLGPDLVAAKRI